MTTPKKHIYNGGNVYSSHVQWKLISCMVFYSLLRNEMETIDPNIIIIDPTLLLNTNIDIIRLEFNRLLKNLREKTKEVPVTDAKAKGLFEKC